MLFNLYVYNAKSKALYDTYLTIYTVLQTSVDTRRSTTCTLPENVHKYKCSKCMFGDFGDQG